MSIPYRVDMGWGMVIRVDDYPKVTETKEHGHINRTLGLCPCHSRFLSSLSAIMSEGCAGIDETAATAGHHADRLACARYGSNDLIGSEFTAAVAA